jgi:hypothetical protein
MTAALSDVGAQLDEHHLPETNGRMSVCRRCGAQTDSPTGVHHQVSEGRALRSSEWLIAQARLRDIETARMMRAN